MNRLPLIIGVLVLVLSLPIAVFLTTKGQTSFPTRASFTGASLSLIPPQGEIANTPISILLATGASQVDGVDAVLSFKTGLVSTQRPTLNPSLLFDNPDNKVLINQVTLDSKTNTATLRFSAIFLKPQSVNTAIASFQLAGPIGTPVSISFTVDSQATHSAVFEHGTAKDILVKTTGGNYSI